MSGQVILLKMGTGRHPAVDVLVPGSLVAKVCNHYFAQDDTIAYVVGAGIKEETLDPTNAIYIADLDDKPTHLSLLLVRGDPQRAMPGFVNPSSRVVKQSKPDEPGFVPGASCHMVISKQEIAAGNDMGRYRMVMESTRGIGRVMARDFIASLMGRYAEEKPSEFVAEKKRRTKKEKPESVSYRPTLRFHPQQNGSLKDDLTDGRIGGFKLSRGSTKFKGEAGEPAVQKLDVQLVARIAPTSDFSKVKKLVDHVQQTLDLISFESLNLELVDEGGAVLENTRAIDIEHLDDADMRYCKKLGMPDFGIGLECRAKFHPATIAFLMTCINNNKHWK
jgi:hypothetical protein